MTIKRRTTKILEKLENLQLEKKRKTKENDQRILEKRWLKGKKNIKILEETVKRGLEKKEEQEKLKTMAKRRAKTKKLRLGKQEEQN